MSTSLRNRLNVLASSFAASVLDAIRGSSLQELLAESSGRPLRALPSRGQLAPAPAASKASAGGPTWRPTRAGGSRLPRRSAGDIQGIVDRVVELLRGRPDGLRAEQIRAELGVSAKELARPLKEGLDTGRFSKSGEKRATTYFSKVAGSGGGVRRPSAGAKKSAGSKGARAAAAKRRRVRRAAPPVPVEEKAPVEPMVATQEPVA